MPDGLRAFPPRSVFERCDLCHDHRVFRKVTSKVQRLQYILASKPDRYGKSIGRAFAPQGSCINTRFSKQAGIRKLNLGGPGCGLSDRLHDVRYDRCLSLLAEAEEPVVEDAEFTEVKAEVDSVEAESTAGASEPEATDEDTEAQGFAGENEDKVDD